MGRRGSLAALLIVLTGAADTPQLREARWTVASARVQALTKQPGECLRRDKDPGAIAIGRVASRTPLLFGGQAARARLSCNSCHRSGRGNAHFVFPGVSGTPGTADVTASLLSSHRGDGVFNPMPIPNLVSDAPKVARHDLRAFIRGLVVEEFDGPEPTAATLDGLTAYVAATDATACGPDVAITLATRVAEVREAVHAATQVSDAPTARLMLAGARDTLGLIGERYAGLSAERALIRRLDAGLHGFQRDLDRGRLPRISRWLATLNDAEPRLRAAESRSLFNPDRLARL